MLLSSNKLALVILTVSALISLAYSTTSSTKGTTSSSAATPSSGAPTSSTQNTTSTLSSTKTTTTKQNNQTITPNTTNKPTTSTNQSSSVVSGTSTNNTVAPSPTATAPDMNSTTSSSLSTTSTTPTTTHAPVCLDQNCTGSFANLSCLDAKGNTCDLGTGVCFQTVVSNDTFSMVHTGCAHSCEAITINAGTNYKEEKRCCSTNLCNSAVIPLPSGSSPTKATSCVLAMFIFVVRMLVK